MKIRRHILALAAVATCVPAHEVSLCSGQAEVGDNRPA